MPSMKFQIFGVLFGTLEINVSIDANRDPSEVAVPNNCSCTSVPSAWSELGQKHGDEKAMQKGPPWVVFRVYSWGMKYYPVLLGVISYKQPL